MTKQTPNERLDERDADERLLEVVSAAMPGADADTRAIVMACAGLFSSVAYADREFSEAEVEQIQRLLGDIRGLDPAGARAITASLKAQVVELSNVHRSRFCRTLAELGDRDLRLHVLELLLQLAAADDEISQDEVATLRQTTTSLGLSQDDYNRLQRQHREKLSTLR